MFNKGGDRLRSCALPAPQWSDTVSALSAGVNVQPSRHAPRLLFVRIPPWLSCNNAHPHDLMWPVATLYARSRAEAAGWRGAILDLHVEQLDLAAATRRVVAYAPDALVIDSMTPTMAWAADLARNCAKALPGLRVWAAGQHATAQPNETLAADVPWAGALRGELDAAIGTVLGDVSGDGATTLRQLEADAWSLPLDPRGLLLDRYGMRSAHVPAFGRTRWGFLLSSRGCPYRCTFCSPTLRQSFGRGFRGQEPRELVEEMARLHLDHRIGAFTSSTT